MKSKKLKFRWMFLCILWVFPCLILSSVEGCDHHQDNQAVNVWGLHMFCEFPIGYPEYLARPDCWAYEGDGGLETNTYLTGFGYVFQLRDDKGNPFTVPGIRYDVGVTWHGPVWYGINADIWEKKAPNGKNYGQINVFPEAGSGTFDNGVVYGRTNNQGIGRIVVRLGGPKERINDPNYPIDYGWQWPDLGGMVIDTGVELKVTIWRPGGQHIVQHFWAQFFRGQWQGFWETSPGIYGNSSQGIGKFPDPFEMQMMSANSSMSDVPLINEIMMSPSLFTSDEAKTPKDRSIRYAFAETGETFPKKKVGIKGMVSTLSNDGITVDQIDFIQLRWDYVEPWGWGWYYFYVEPGESLHPLFCVDPNDPNEVMGLLHDAEPYCWWTYLTLPEPFDGNTGMCTVFLRAVDDYGAYDPNKDLLIPSFLYDKNGNQVLMQSAWVCFSEDPNFHGYYDVYYEDGGGDPYVVTYVVLYLHSGYHPVLYVPEYGDFNADGNVGWKDVGLFSEQYLVNDPNIKDWRFKDPNNPNQGPANLVDMAGFAPKWSPND